MALPDCRRRQERPVTDTARIEDALVSHLGTIDHLWEAT